MKDDEFYQSKDYFLGFDYGYYWLPAENSNVTHESSN